MRRPPALHRTARFLGTARPPPSPLDAAAEGSVARFLGGHARLLGTDTQRDQRNAYALTRLLNTALAGVLAMLAAVVAYTAWLHPQPQRAVAGAIMAAALVTMAVGAAMRPR